MLSALSALVCLPLAAPLGERLFDETHRLFPSDGDISSAVLLVDLDGDLDLDVVLATRGLDDNQPVANRIYMNLGEGRYEDRTPAPVALALATTYDVVAGDWNGDGAPDLFMANDGQDHLWLNQGGGQMSDATATGLPAQGGKSYAAAAGDVDGDGDLDLVVGTSWGEVQQLLGDGAGHFSLAGPSGLPVGGGAVADLALADLDGDTDLDLALARSGGCGAIMGCVGAANALYLGDGSGSFVDASGSLLPAGVVDQTESVLARDLDGDGDVDLVFGNGLGLGWAPEADRVLLNDSTGHMLEVALPWLGLQPVAAANSLDLALGDVNADGIMDLFATGGVQGSYAEPSARLFLGLGGGQFFDVTATWLPLVLERSDAVALGDVDGDGDPDAVLGNQWRDRLLLGDPAVGLFDSARLEPPRLPLLEDGSYDLALGDLDADGDLDLVVGNYFTSNELLLNDGSGSFEDHSASGLPATLDEMTRGIGLGDVDADGDLDIVVGNLVQQSLLWLNDGSAVFQDAPAGSLPADDLDYTTDVGLVDVEGDGDLDLVMANTKGPSRLWLNGGSGKYVEAPLGALPWDADETEGLALGDIDLDGAPDLVLANYGSQDRLLMGDGTGAFVDRTASLMPPDSAWSQAAALGDLDADGDLDLVFATTENGAELQNRVYLWSGTGGYADATLASLPQVKNHSGCLGLCDVDGDGDLDLYFGNWGYLPGQSDRLFFNDGAAQFTEASDLLPPGRDPTVALAFGDLDGDSDPDLVLCNLAHEDRVLSNFTRQLDLERPARLGKTGTMGLFGPASSPFLLAASTGELQLAAPPYGVLRIDPASVLLWIPGSLDPLGHAEVDLAVPASPALAGLTVAWQALLQGPGGPGTLVLSNLDRSTLSAL